VREALAVLAAAKRPVIIAGGGVVTSGAQAELVQLAEKLSIPVATSLNGKGIIPENHPLALGLMGTYGRWGANQAVAEADVAFFIGSQAGGHVTNNWNAPVTGTTIIHCDVEPEEIGRNYPAKVGLLGDAQVTLQMMIEMAQPAAPRTEWLSRTRSLVRDWWAAIDPNYSSDATPIRPERVCKEIAGFLPPNAVIVADTGHSAQWTGCLVELVHPGQRFIRCSGTLGWGFPASLGVKCALPDRPVLAFVGDAAMYYHVSELETAARLGINTVTIVNNNASWGQTSRGIRTAFGGLDTTRGRGVWRFKQTDFVTVAEGMGCIGFRVEKAADIRPALEQAFAADRPAVIEIRTDIDARPPAAWK
jgi:acetolactate synthase-1/2/3 large subunit